MTYKKGDLVKIYSNKVSIYLEQKKHERVPIGIFQEYQKGTGVVRVLPLTSQIYKTEVFSYFEKIGGL